MNEKKNTEAWLTGKSKMHLDIFEKFCHWYYLLQNNYFCFLFIIFINKLNMSDNLLFKFYISIS